MVLMKSKDDKKFNTLNDLVGLILGVIDKQVKLINEIGPRLTEHNKAAILQTEKDYLVFFRDVAAYLNSNFRSRIPEKNYRFLLPNIRALFEIFANLLYLTSVDESMAMRVCVISKLVTLAQVLNIGAENDEEAFESYTDWYDLHSEFLASLSVQFPRDPKNLNRKFLKKNKIQNPSIFDMVQPEWIQSATPETIKMFPNLVKDPYKMYAYFSNYVHANVLVKGFHGREKYWTFAELIMRCLLVTEIVDGKILNNSNSQELETLRVQCKKHLPSFVEIWQGAQFREV